MRVMPAIVKQDMIRIYLAINYAVFNPFSGGLIREDVIGREPIGLRKGVPPGQSGLANAKHFPGGL